MLTLYHHWESTCSMKVRFALHEKNLEHDKVFVDLLAFEQLTPDYLAINPNGVAPTLVHGGASVLESTVINEYLEEVFPDPPLLPADPVRRAETRALVRLEDGRMEDAIKHPTYHLLIKKFFSSIADEELDRIVSLHPQPQLGAYWKKTLQSPADHALVEQAYVTLQTVIERLERTLDDGRTWLAGDSLTLADCAFVPLVDRLEVLGRPDMFVASPAVDGWRERLKARPSYTAAVPSADQRKLPIL